MTEQEVFTEIETHIAGCTGFILSDADLEHIYKTITNHNREKAVEAINKALGGNDEYSM